MNWEEIRHEYETTDATPKELAERYHVKASTLRSRKNREHWQRKPKKVATQRNAVATHVAKKLNKNASLTEKQKQFCLFYLQRFNATWAYQKVYKCNYDTARNNGPRMLANACIKKQISKLKEQQQADLYLTADDILREYVKQAFSSLGDVLNYKSTEETVTDSEGVAQLDIHDDAIRRHVTDIYLKPSSEIDWSVVQEIHRGKDGLVVKLYDKQKAMKELIDRLPEATKTMSRDTLIDALKIGIELQQQQKKSEQSEQPDSKDSQDGDDE